MSCIPFFFCIHRSSTGDASSWCVHPRLWHWSWQLELELELELALPNCHFLYLTRYRLLSEPGTPFPDHQSSSTDHESVPAFKFTFDLHIKVEKRVARMRSRCGSQLLTRYDWVAWKSIRSSPNAALLHLRQLWQSSQHHSCSPKLFLEEVINRSSLAYIPRTPPKASRRSSLHTWPGKKWILPRFSSRLLYGSSIRGMRR